MRNLIKVILLLLILLISSSKATAKGKWDTFRKTAYAKSNIIIYNKEEKDKYDTYVKGDKIKILAKKDGWYQVRYNHKKRYIKSGNISFTKVKKSKGKKLNKCNGVVNGPTGRESYYNLPMNKVVSVMRQRGFNAKKYPYWVRQDGCKMLGSYIIVAANYRIHKKGSIVDTSLGQGIVCDTGSFIHHYPGGLDVAVNW